MLLNFNLISLSLQGNIQYSHKSICALHNYSHMISVHKLIQVDFLDNQSKLERFVFNLYTRVIVVVKEESGERGGGGVGKREGG